MLTGLFSGNESDLWRAISPVSVFSRCAVTGVPVGLRTLPSRQCAYLFVVSLTVDAAWPVEFQRSELTGIHGEKCGSHTISFRLGMLRCLQYGFCSGYLDFPGLVC